MSKKFAFAQWMLPVLMLLFAATAFAQNTASIQGTVMDSTGATVTGAKVVVKNTAQALERTTQTGVGGVYEVPALPPGTYSVEVTMTGFQTQLANDVVLQVSQNSVQNFSLKLASTTEVVTVEAKAPVIEATTMTVGQTINQRTVQDIPLNGRHFVDLALLVPGTVVPPQNGFLTAPLRGQGSFAFNSAGGREDAVNFMINGINLNDMVQNQVTFQPTINTVSEFKIDNSTYSAEYGRNSGSIVNVATRSGTDNFHGEVYDYLRNSWFDARNAFNFKTSSTGAPLQQAPFKRNQFGGDFGGPLWKGKTYFFLSYEGLRHRQGLNITSNVFPDTTPISQPALISRASIQTAGKPVANKLLGLIPHANTTIGNSLVPNAFVGSATAPVNIDQGTVDISHNFSDADSLHGYYAIQKDFRGEPTQGTSIPGFGDTREGKRQVLTVGETHVFSPNVVNEVRFGANRIHIVFTPQNATTPASLGLGGTLGPNLTFMPTINIADQGLLFGDERGFPQGRGDTAFLLGDTVSWIRGRHSFKFGVEGRDFRNDNFNSDPGQLVYNTSAQFQNDSVASAANVVGNVSNRINQGALDLFAQDSWRLTSYFTAELGLRYAWNMTPSEAKNRFYTFVPAPGNGSMIVQSPLPYAQNNKNFQPRIGFAWDLFHTGNTVLRGGYAFQVDQPITGFVTGLNSNPPLALPINVGANAISALPAFFNGPPTIIGPSLINPNFRNANVQSWNLNIQQQMDRNTAFMVGYFASKGTHLEVDHNVNQLIALGQPNTIASPNVPFFRLSPNSPTLPNVQLAGILTERDSNGNSNYNALWISVNRRMSQGLQFNASYTWSHSSDDVSRNNNGIVVQDSNNIGGSRGDSDFDARHRFVANLIYDLPFKGNRFTSGWEVAPIFSFQSGNPFDVVISSSTITGVGNTVFPNLVGNLIVTNNPFGQWVLPSSFALPPAGTFGTFGRNKIVGPGFGDIDFALIKNTKLTERLNLQFVANAFDILNHPNYGQPNRVFAPNSTTFGTILSTRFPTGDSGSSRQLQFAVKVQF